MALDNFKEVYSDSYQEIFQKVLVGKKLANMRFQSGLSYGESVTRIKADISSILVRDVTVGSDRTVDSLTDSEETLTVNNQKGTTFALSTKEMVQAGPLSPAQYVGAKVAHKTATAVDADILYECVNAFADFDTGDLTTLSSSGVPITLSSTTVPQMVPRMPAKLRANNQMLTNMAFVIDSYGVASIAEYIQGKEVDAALSTFRNGSIGGSIAGAEVFSSENLTGEAVLSLATLPTAGDSITVNGVTFQFVASIGNPGDIHIAANVDNTRLILEAAFNDIGTAIPEGTNAGYTPVSAADQAIWNALRITATNDSAADTLTIVAKGSGRLTVSETLTDGTDTWTKNFIHAYFGKKGAIDVVIQEEVDMEMREEPKQRATNIMSDVLYGIKTFDDGAQQFLDVLIAA